MEINRKIARWLGVIADCSNVWGKELVGYWEQVCPDCGAEYNKHQKGVPDYTTSPTAMVELIEAVRGG